MSTVISFLLSLPHFLQCAFLDNRSLRHLVVCVLLLVHVLELLPGLVLFSGGFLQNTHHHKFFSCAFRAMTASTYQGFLRRPTLLFHHVRFFYSLFHAQLVYCFFLLSPLLCLSLLSATKRTLLFALLHGNLSLLAFASRYSHFAWRACRARSAVSFSNVPQVLLPSANLQSARQLHVTDTCGKNYQRQTFHNATKL